MWQIHIIMTKTQISVPDELYEKAKKIARDKEWSLAEVFRRGLEYMASTHLDTIEGGEWELPVIKCEAPDRQSARQLDALIQQEREAYLHHKGGL